MYMVSLASMSFLWSIVAVVWVLIAVTLILIILIQKGKGGGLSGAFGGGMAQGLLGSKTGDVLTWITITLAITFLFFAVLLDKFYRPTISSNLQDAVQTQTPPAEQPVSGQTPPAEQPTSGQTPPAEQPAGQNTATDAE